MKERPSKENTPREKVRETKPIHYLTFEGPMETILTSLNGLVKSGGWEGVGVLNLYWNKGAEYQLYRHREENDEEYNNRLRGLQGMYDYKVKKLEALKRELEA